MKQHAFTPVRRNGKICAIRGCNDVRASSVHFKDATGYVRDANQKEQVKVLRRKGVKRIVAEDLATKSGEAYARNTAAYEEGAEGGRWPKVLKKYKLTIEPELTSFEGGATRSAKAERRELIPAEAISALGRRLALEAKKHGANNWRKGGEEFRLATIDRLLDRIFDYIERGNASDANTDAIICNAAFLCEYEARTPYKGVTEGRNGD